MTHILKLAGLFLLLALSLGASQGEQIWLYGGGTFGPDDEVGLEYSVPPNEDATLTLYRVGNPEKVLELGGPADFGDVEALELRRVQVQRVRLGADTYYGDASFGTLRRGLYFAQLESGSRKSATLILVTDLSLVVKTDADTVLAYTAEGASGEPRKARVYLLDGRTRYAEGLANDEGLTEFSTGSSTGTPDDLVVAAKFGDSWVFSNAYWRSWALENARVYVQTDRSVYRPGHTVFFKGTARAPSGLAPLAGKEVQFVVRDADGSEIFADTFSTDAYGSFDGELALSAAAPLGSYSLEATLDGETSYASLEVQAFQKPEYRVGVTPNEGVAVQGNTATFTVNGEYLFGGPVAGGKVNYAILKAPYYRWRYTSSYGFYEDYDYTATYGGDLIERGEGVLDAEGNLTVTVALTEGDEDYTLTLQAGVSDEARREVSGSGSLVAYRAGIVLDVQTDRYAYETGETALATVRAEDLQGNPVSVPFSLATERYVWEAGESRTIRGQTYQGQTNADGVGTVALEFSEGGSYNLIATAQDASGRQTAASDYAWVSGSERWYWAYDGLTITPDKEEYEVGETARFVVQSPVADAYALVTLEGDSLAAYEMVKLEGSVLTYELPVTAAMTPNGYLSVTIVGDGVTYTDTAGFRVPPDDKFLNVELLSDEDTYEPGETGRFGLRVSDASGRGVEAQVALALVDEGIFLVQPDQTPDIRGFFYALKSSVVGTQLSDWYYFGNTQPFADGEAAAAPRAAMDEAEFAQSKAEFATADLREDFRDTILWLPTLQTNADGTATTTVTFPDNLTEWRLTARAITLGDEVGQNTYSVKTTLPVIARLAAPRFFIKGDEASLRVVGQSNLDTDQEGRLELSADGLTVLDTEPQPTTLPAEGRSSADFNVSANTTGTASVTAAALTPAASDAMKVPLPVLPHGLRDELGWADEGNTGWTFTLPANADLSTAAGTLYLTPSLAAAVSPALSYLAGYPYGCTEQTMSRFYPSVLAARAGSLARLPDDIAANLDDIVAQGLERLHEFQHDDGGWGFWQYDSSSPFISAYVVNGLLESQEAGYRIKDEVLGSALDYLEAVVQTSLDVTTDGGRLVDADAKAYAYLALARAGRSIDGLGSVVGRADMSPYGLALSVLAFHEVGRDVEANLYLDELLSRVTERDRVAYWETNAPRYYWNDDRVEATAYALEALAELRPDAPVLPKVVNWLLLERNGARWVSTKDTAAVVRAALTLADTTGESTSDYQVSASLNGAELVSTSLNQTNQGAEVPLDGFDAGPNVLEVNVSGGGTLYSSAAVSFFSEQEDFTPQRDDFTISRRYQRLEPVYNESEQRYIYSRTTLRGPAEVGDYLLVTVTLDPKDDYRYVLVNEPLPAGYRVIEDDGAFRVAGVEPRHGYDYYGWNYWFDGREVYDERVDYYFAELSSPVTFTYILRAETPGTFAALPTQAWLMYEPEVEGTGPDATLQVVEEGQ